MRAVEGAGPYVYEKRPTPSHLCGELLQRKTFSQRVLKRGKNFFQKFFAKKYRKNTVKIPCKKATALTRGCFFRIDLMCSPPSLFHTVGGAENLAELAREAKGGILGEGRLVERDETAVAVH